MGSGLTFALFLVGSQGMGEPLNNIRAVRRALSVISHPHTFNLSKNMITVSTVGTKVLVP